MQARYGASVEKRHMRAIKRKVEHLERAPDAHLLRKKEQLLK
jgi:hypothetical protein